MCIIAIVTKLNPISNRLIMKSIAYSVHYCRYQYISHCFLSIHSYNQMNDCFALQMSIQNDSRIYFKLFWDQNFMAFIVLDDMSCLQSVGLVLVMEKLRIWLKLSLKSQ